MEGRWCSARRPGPPYRTRFLDNPRYACFACSAQCTEICKCSSLLQMYFTVAVLKSSGSASTKQSRFGDGLLSWDGESHLGAHELMAMAHNDTGLLQHARLLTLVASLLCLVQVISFGSHSTDADYEQLSCTHQHNILQCIKVSYPMLGADHQLRMSHHSCRL